MDAGRNNSGFTLVEMIITVAIIVILAAMLIGVGGALDKQSKRQGAKNLLAQIEAAIDLYYDFNGDYPVVGGGGAMLRCQNLYRLLNSAPDSRRILGQINSKLIRDEYDVAGNVGPEIYDPWNKPVDYAYDKATDSYPRLISAGPDKVFGTADDITNR